jgi:hypothetical protein
VKAQTSATTSRCFDRVAPLAQQIDVAKDASYADAELQREVASGHARAVAKDPGQEIQAIDPRRGRAR